MNQREIALDIIYKSIKDETYTNLYMRKKLNELPKIQRPFVTELVNGVLRKLIFLENQFVEFCNSKTSLRNKIIISMGLYERFYMNEKDYVVNNEYTELGNKKFDKSFINAILHKCNTVKPFDGNTVEEKAIASSLPLWIYKLLSSQYDEEQFNRILMNYSSKANIYYRLNRRYTFDDLENLKINKITDKIFTSEDNLINSKEFSDGMFYIQDINSSSLVDHLDLHEDHVFLDVCSAPGSKLFNALDIVKEENAYGNDLHSHRVELIRSQAKHLGFNNLNLVNYDARVLKDHLDVKFDRILLDVPCSGLGVIGRKPDIMYHLEPSNLDGLQSLQQEILESILPLLKDDGKILYSTCTLNKKENRRQIDSFLRNHQEFVLETDDTVINDMGDSFYYALLKRI